MAIAGDQEAYFVDELSASSLRDLQQRFPEIPDEVVSSSLKKNGGNMSNCIKELEIISQSYLYGDFVGHDTPTCNEVTAPNPTPRTNAGAATYTSQFYTPDQRVGVPSPIRDRYDHQVVAEDPDRTPQPSILSWASIETGVPSVVEPRSELGYCSADEERHVSKCTLDIPKPPMRTISVPNVASGRGSPMPDPPHFRGETLHRPSSTPYGMTSNGLEQREDLRNFPFEPRPAWQEQVPNLPLDPLPPSSPATKPRKSKPSPSPGVAMYSKATDRISFHPGELPGRASPKPEGDISAHQTSAKPAGGQTSGEDPIPPKRKEKSKRREGTLGPFSLPLDRSTSKEKEDQAYTEALLMHQRARYERLIKELEEEKLILVKMKEETADMEGEVSHKRKNHRSPFPTLEQIGKLREQKHQLQIDIECMTREIESYKSQGLMDVTKATSFYGNMGSTGAPGPVPPIPNNPINESTIVIESEPPPPSYESLMWSCSACTLLNHPALDKCECCEMPRDK